MHVVRKTIHVVVEKINSTKRNFYRGKLYDIIVGGNHDKDHTCTYRFHY